MALAEGLGHHHGYVFALNLRLLVAKHLLDLLVCHQHDAWGWVKRWTGGL